MIHTVVFDSAKEGQWIGLACGHISLTDIVFQAENISASIEAKTGQVVFSDLEGTALLTTCVPLPAAGDEKFSEVKCSVTDRLIRLEFPQYSYEDNYPHCDGEHDRWTKKISGSFRVCYDFKNNCIED